MKTFYSIRLALIAISCFLLSITLQAQISVTATQGSATGSYITLKGAFDAINAGTHQGSIVIKVTGSTTETSSAVLYKNGYNFTSSYTDITIYPTVSGLSVTGNLVAPLIDLNGATNVMIDGRVNATGTGTDLAISNSSTSNGSSTIRFINAASANTVKYSNIKGSSLDESGGIVVFKTSTTTGNNNNTIDHNVFTNAGGNRPVNAIYSFGTASANTINTGGAITDNVFYNFFNASATAASSSGIYLGSNTSAFTITGNSFYDTETLSPTSTGAYYPIYINSTSGGGFTVSNNNIGGSDINNGGTAWTKTNSNNNIFAGIYLNVGSAVASTVQGNTIRNISWANSGNANWWGINANAGNVSIINNNTIGATTGTGSITLTNGGGGGFFYGINTNVSNPSIQNNSIGSITAGNSTATLSTNIYGIYTNSTGNIRNNVIGSTTTANSINASGTSTSGAQTLYGIYGGTNIAGNTVANMTNGTTNPTGTVYGLICGIYGGSIVSNNAVSYLTIANANVGTSNTNASVIGISTSANPTSGNSVSNLSNSYASFAGALIGIYYNAPANSSVSGNFINSLSVTGASSTAAGTYGMVINNSSGYPTTFSNNIITLGGNTATNLFGISEYGSATNNLYFNTVYLGGTLASGATNKSYALYSQSSTTRNFRNNIFVNERSTAGGANLHYAAYFTTAGVPVLNYNIYRATGTGGMLGYSASANQPALPIFSGQDANSSTVDPAFAVAGGTLAANYYPAAAQNGVTGTDILLDYGGNLRNATTPKIGALESSTITLPGVVTVTATQGTASGSYSNLKGAFDAINAGTHKGSIAIQVAGSTVETAKAILYQTGYNSASSYTDINIYPTSAGVSIVGNLATPLIDFDGATNVVIDGRVNATGTVADMTIINTNTTTTAGTSTIRFIDGASGNTVKYANLRGSTRDAAGGVVFFSTSTATTGNNNNIIDHNNITNAGGRPVITICSIGTSGKTNSGNSISNNAIYDFFNAAVANPYGVYISNYSDAFAITGNSFYETTSFAPTSTGTYYPIYIYGATGVVASSTVTGNYIGGSAPLCGGAAWTKTNSNANPFTGIYMQTGGAVASTIQGNTISNISWANTTTGDWTGIDFVSGNVNAVSNNSIGAATGTGSITYTTSSGTFSGIRVGSTTANIQNNTIGSITAANANAANATNFYGIYTSNALSVSNNLIGSTTTPNSINVSSASTGAAQTVYGIYAWNQNITVTGNTIANLTNGTTNTTVATYGFIRGIYSLSNVITNNVVRNLTIANANTGSAYDNIPVAGISIYPNGQRIVNGNTISNLSNSNATFAGNVAGLIIGGGNNTVSGNLIHSLSVSGASSTAASIYGVNLVSGVNTASNNIISLGGSTATTLYGIYETGAAATNNNLYFNTVYLGGSLASGVTNKSYALYSAVVTNTRDFRNNILVNERSTTGGANLHYAAYFNYNSSGNLTLNYNDYRVAGTGGVLGYYNTANVTSLPLISTMDANSLNVTPGFANAGGTSAADYYPAATLAGSAVAGILADYGGTARPVTPKMGALESTAIAPLSNKLTVTATQGTASADYLTLKEAFDAINTGTHKGSIAVKLTATTIETATAALYQSGYSGISAYTDITIYPTTTGLSIKGNMDAPLIDLNGATNVVIDGRVNATGTVPDMTILNASTSTVAGTSTIRFINAASNNTVKYSIISGSTGLNGGSMLYFADGVASKGNSNNTIDHNNITNAGGIRPYSIILSSPTNYINNSGNVISNNNFYDLLSYSNTYAVIDLRSYNTGWSITGNSFYETAAFTPISTSAYSIITINIGGNVTISNNYIGGSAPLCGGTAFIKTGNSNNFTGIRIVSVGTTVASSVQGNTISNMSWTNSSNNNWTGIAVEDGAVNIGTESANIIGAATGTGSITLSGSGGSLYGINTAGTGSLNVQNNIIGSITTAGASGVGIYGFYNTGTGLRSISNNIIGNASTANSINAGSTGGGAQSVFGIYQNAAANATISGNTIANLNNATTNASSYINGIYAGAGSNNIINNTIQNLSIANGNTASTYQASVGGIVLNTTAALTQTISGNSINNLTNSHATFAGIVNGIYYAGGTTAGNVSGNFIRGLWVSGVSSTGASIYGVNIASGAATYSNNIITLGGNTATTLYGIYETGAASNNNSLYFNTVYLGGSLTSGMTNKSYALYSAATTNTRDFRNNIFVNERSTAAGANLHYAAYFNYAANTGLTLNCNTYRATGTGGVLGYYNSANVTALPLISAMDANSLNVDPGFASAGGALAVNYYPSATLAGVSGTGMLLDYGGNQRAATPQIGALESATIASGNKVNVVATLGTVSGSYSTLKGAFDAINAGTHQGVIAIQLVGSTTEFSTATLYQSGYNSTSSYVKINIYPKITGLSITGNLAAPLIELNGVSNVVIDGRVNAVGTEADLTILNSSAAAIAGTSTIRFINGVAVSTVKYAKIQGLTMDATGGVLNFSTTNSTTGNCNITIDRNIISNAGGASRPLNVVYSVGTAAYPNTTNTISNNAIYNFFNATADSYGVYLGSNTSAWTITGNSFYETTSFAPSSNGACYPIYITNTSGSGFTVTGNYIGGSAPLCGGTAWTKTNTSYNAFNAIYMDAGATPASSVQGNTISNINWANSTTAAWIGIHASGIVNVGTVTANVIGAATGTGSITLTNGATGGQLIGIRTWGGGTVNVQNNSIGSLTTAGSPTTLGTNIVGIYAMNSGASSTITKNTIGSTTTTNSINASSPSTTNQQSVYGIYYGGLNANINGNTIANLTNSISVGNTAVVNGIYIHSATGACNIVNNEIRNLSNSNPFAGAGIDAAVCGIVLNNSTATAVTITGNTISYLSNTSASFAGNIYGIYYYGSSVVGNVSGNFIHSLSVSGASSTAANIYGIFSNSGSVSYSNNIISLGGNTLTTLYGIYLQSMTVNNLYFNTVYLGGTLASGATNKSYALYSQTSVDTRDFRNNMFVNERSTVAGANLHYAAYFNYGVNTNLTLNANNYRATGTGGVLGYYNSANVTALPIISTKDANSLTIDPAFASAGGTAAANYYPSASGLNGLAGIPILVDYFGNIKNSIAPKIGALESATPVSGDVSVTATQGAASGSYSTLKGAFDAINAGTHRGSIVVQLKSTTTEVATAALYQSGYNFTSDYTDIKIYPTSSGLGVYGNLAAPLIDLNGATNVVIDGRVNATGTVADMTIINSNASATAGNSTIRFINQATGNTVKYTNLRGSTTNTTSGLLFFSGSTTALGNSNNTIDHNTISNAAGNRPVNTIYSQGSGKYNDGIIISDNAIFNFFNPANASYGITTGWARQWTIAGNSFYETENFVPSAAGAYYSIYITGGSHTVTGNYIGGSAPLCAGTPWTKTNANDNVFAAIYMGNDGTVTSSVQGNTISNISWANSGSANWWGINVPQGIVNVGNITGNTIGSGTGTGSITLSNGATGGNLYGIAVAGIYTCSVLNNIVGGISSTNSNATMGTNIYGIFNQGSGFHTISNNLIGSTTTANSINAGSACTGNVQTVYGIYQSGTFANQIISGNTIANITNGTTNTTVGTYGLINGIYASAGGNSIVNNTVRNLSIANANTATDFNASVAGIVNTSTSDPQAISGNSISSLNNSYASFAGSVVGIYQGSSSNGTASGNFIRNLSVSGVSSTSANISGIRIVAGTFDYSNNIISLGGNTPTNLYGIYESAISGTNKLYFNTVYLGGSLSSVSNKSYALYSATSTTTRDFRNNVFVNERSTTGGSSLHYAAWFNYGVNTSLTLNYNDYRATGTGGVLGYYNSANVTALPIISTMDANSLNVAPSFANAGGVLATDYYPAATLTGGAGTPVMADYGGNLRAATPKMGALESAVMLPVGIVNVTATQGAVAASYGSLRDAFAAVNAGTHKGSIAIQIAGSLVESATATLYKNGYNTTSSYTDINIYPTLPGLSVYFSNTSWLPMIDLNGATNVVIDGRVNREGTVADLTLSNSNGPAIQFKQGASGNTVKFANLRGSSMDASSGVLLFSTSSGTSGNNNNTIDRNTISNAGGVRPVNAVFAQGTGGVNQNTGNIISNNTIYDFFNAAGNSYGINLSSGNASFAITGNSFYETGSYAPTSTGSCYPIYLSGGILGITITGNYIGGSAPLCGGAPWTKTNSNNNAFTGIYMGVGSTMASSVQGNTISNISWANNGSADWRGMEISSGTVYIGTESGNTIGAATGTGSITLTNAATGGSLYGIKNSGSSNCYLKNNIVGSITAANSTAAAATNMYGVYILKGTMSNNVIGSTTTANSMNATGASTGNVQNVYGIYVNGNVTVSDNTIANITNGTTNSTVDTNGLINGIFGNTGVVISNNTVRDLTIANANTQPGFVASVGGIVVINGLNTITGNSISNLSNSFATFAGDINGIFHNGINTGTTTGTVSGNLIRNLSVSGASSTAARIYGIKMDVGLCSGSNNIINLGGTTLTTLYGIYESTASSVNNNLYHNTVYLSGTMASGATNKSYALYSAVSSGTRDFRNNILVNERSTTGGANLHYAAWFNYAVNTGLTLNYNDYRATGTGGVLGRWSSTDKTVLPIVTAMDANSLTLDPSFASAGGALAANYFPAATLPGTAVSLAAADYLGNVRPSTPKMGALEATALDASGTAVLVTATEGTASAGYSSLKGAFDAINAGTHKGSIVLGVAKSTQEYTTATLYQSGYNSTSAYTDIKIYPTTTGLSISGSMAAPLIDLSGATNVVMDGRVNAEGTVADMTITNTSTAAVAGTSTIRFINGASGNTVQYTKLRGSSMDTNGGVLYFSTLASATGNSNNSIDNNTISNAGGNRPKYTIYSGGLGGNTISNNAIFDFFNPTTGSVGIYLSSASTGFTIAGNSFYETTTFAPTNANYYVIQPVGTIVTTITGNYIGGSAPLCGGTAWTKTGFNNCPFTGIYMQAHATTASSVQGNTISNISWTSGGSDWCGIDILSGAVNVGTVTGNIIGAATGTGAITYTSNAVGTSFYGIRNGSSGCTISNNIIGGISTANSIATNATHIYGIYTTVAGTISNNRIGSTTTANSINASSASTGYSQMVYGIYGASGKAAISGNTIANMTNGTTNTTATTYGLINGIYSTDGIIRNNTISNLSIANANTATDYQASVGGIVLNAPSATAQDISGNSISGLTNSYASFAGTVTGIHYTGSATASSVSGNFIRSLTISGASSTGYIYGIKAVNGVATYSNNIISLGDGTRATLYGVYDNGGTISLYFNTVYLGGICATWAGGFSAALFSASNSNTRDYRNNILVNERSTVGVSGVHSAIQFQNVGTTGLTLNYNLYRATGTNYLGLYGAAITTLPIVSGMDANSMVLNPSFVNAGGAAAGDYCVSATLPAAMGIAIGTDYGGKIRSAFPTMGAFESNVILPAGMVAVTATQGTASGSYSTLKAAFDAINSGTHKGNIDIQVVASTAETATATLYQSGYNSASSYTNISIYPTATDLSITGNMAMPLIDLNGATNVVIDGRVNRTGTVADLTLLNSNISATASTSTIRFINGASGNTIKYTNLRGSTMDTQAGVLFFSTSTAGIGNINNTIDHNAISNVVGNRPVNVVYSSGTGGKANNGNIISNNTIYNFFNPAAGVSNGLYMDAVSSITGNSFYETDNFAPTSTGSYYAIRIGGGTSGFTVTGNYIGGSAPLCGGTPWMKTNSNNNSFTGIDISSTGGALTDNVQGNTIANINWANSSSAYWTGINVGNGANVNVGTETANTIGAATGTGSITLTNGASGGYLYGITASSSGTVNVKNNSIGSLTSTSPSSFAAQIYGINCTGSATVSNNLIGSASTANSIYISSPSGGQALYGIYQAVSGVLITGNTIANLGSNATSGKVDGIYVNGGKATITNNTITNLSTVSSSSGTDAAAAVGGIVLNTTVAAAQTISANNISNLSNSLANFSGTVCGIYYAGGTTASNVSGNFIRSLSVSATSTSANVYGIKITSGLTTYSNNIITLGGSTATTLYGIHENGAASNDNSLYFNTVYLGGSLASGASNKSYALYRQGGGNVSNIRNNIFVNDRSTIGGASLHYAAYISSSSNLVLDYNDYRVSGTGGVTGYSSGDKTALPLVTGMDSRSVVRDPIFATAGGLTATDYIPSAGLVLSGISGTGIATDYEGSSRSTNPVMGAFEYVASLEWTGAVDTDWNTDGNWSAGFVPDGRFKITIPNVTNKPVIAIGNGGEAGNVIINAGASLTVNGTLQTAKSITVNAGSTLAVAGTVRLGGTINNSGTFTAGNASTVDFNGASAQTIPALNYNNLTVSNAGAVSLAVGTIGIAGAFTPGTAVYTVNGSTVNYNGTTAQVIAASNYNNLMVSNTNAMTLATGTIGIAGTFTPGTASYTVAGNNVEFNGTSVQTIPSFTYNGITLNNSAGASLSGGDVTVNNTLKLTNGVLALGNNNLILANQVQITGTPSATNMIVTNGTGIVKKMLSSILTYTFPVGDTSGNYTPITMNFTSGTFGSNAYVGVKVVNAQHPNNVGSDKYLKRYWSVSSSGISSFSCDVTANYVVGDVIGGETNLIAASYTGAMPWLRYSNLASNTLTANGVTSFPADYSGVAKSSVIITANPGLTVSKFSTATLTASPAGSAPFMYSWSNGSTTQSISPSTMSVGTTTYSVTTTDVNGAVATATVDFAVIDLPRPTITAGSATTFCSGGSVVLTSSLGTTYQWYLGGVAIATDGTSQTYTATTSGDYTVAIINAQGYASSQSLPITVTVNTPVVSGTLSVTIGSTTQLTGSGTAATSDAWFSASTGKATVSATGLVTGVSEGTSVITYTNSDGCSATATITVVAVAPSNLSYTATNVFGNGVTISPLSPTVNDGGGVMSYSVSPALPAGLSLNTSTGVISGTPTALSAAADYTVTATNSGGNTTFAVNIAVINSYAVSFSATNGTLTVKKGSTELVTGALVIDGDVITLTTTPNTGYVLGSLKANGTDVVGNSVTVSAATSIVATFTVPQWTGTTNTDWNEPTNWTPNVVPTSLIDIVVNNAVNTPVVGDNSVCNNLTVNTGGVITIPAGKSLTVEGSITNNAGVAGIIIKSDALLPTGTLIYHNAQNTPAQATVEMYSKASWNLTNTSGNKYKWQFFGIPVRTMVVSPTLNAALVRRYDESQVTNNWFAMNSSSILDPFKGYEIVQEAAKKYAYTGDLVNADYSQTLTKTSGVVNAGNHLFANPYTAAIDITKLNFGTQTDATVYLYNTGTVNEWSTYSGSTNGANPGQYTAAPKATAGVGGIPAQIPSMQGFVVKALSNDVNATFGIPYSAVVTKNVDLQRVKSEASSTASNMVYSIVDVVGATGGDRMWLFSDPGCSHNFDNGWDGRKMLGSTLVPQLYAKESDGDYQVNSVNDVNNTDLGFQAGTDSDYKLRFTHNNVKSVYSKLYLFDYVTNTTTDITESGTEYSFTANAGTSAAKRFKIVSTTSVTTSVDPVDNKGNKDNKVTVFSSKNTVYVDNGTDTKGDLLLYDVTGRYLQKLPFGASTITAIPLGLNPGVYVAKVVINNQTVVTKNVILQ